MENLNQELLIEILSRLPVESVLQCRQVCKAWRLLQLHKVGFISLMGVDSSRGQLCYGEYDETIQQSCKTVARINHTLIQKYSMDAIVGSCNGLICFSVREDKNFTFNNIYICNPVTREYINLPGLVVDRYGVANVVYGFGYHPSVDEYKVCRIYYHKGQQFEQPLGDVEVYTLGSGSGWRKKREVIYSLRPSAGILADGALHWLDREGKILAFDLIDEDFCLLPSPPCFTRGMYNKFKLCVLEGWLCVVHCKSGATEDIWSLKKNNSNDQISGQGTQSFSWIREFSITPEGKKTSDIKPIALLKSGKVLLWCNGTILSRFDPKTATLEKLVNLDSGLQYFQAIPHMNSSVSLKALGEDTKIIESVKEVDAESSRRRRMKNWMHNI